MVADDPAARPAPEKLAAVDEVREVTPDGPCRALDLVGGAPPSAEQGDVTPPHRGPGLSPLSIPLSLRRQRNPFGGFPAGLDGSTEVLFT